MRSKIYTIYYILTCIFMRSSTYLR
uniref:Uncharacterized protein n=1 Tax=Rhizophora mucronata TaxID=61149 RepID=A0A2P2PGG4_RHIMU